MSANEQGAGQTTTTTTGSAFSLNRVVVLLGPLVAILAGAIASWLGTHFPGLHVNTTKTAGAITTGVDFVIVAGGTLLLHSKWLEGWQKWEASEYARVAAATLAQTNGEPPAAHQAAALAATTARPIQSGLGQGTLSDG